MRTTLNIDDDVLERAKSVAEVRRISVGEALSLLARRGLEAQVDLELDPMTGLMVLRGAGISPLSLEEINRLEADEDYEKYQDLTGKK